MTGIVHPRRDLVDDGRLLAAIADDEYLDRRDTHVHLYGKAEARPGRKMGHLTRVRPERS